jgi:hypothetical protein
LPATQATLSRRATAAGEVQVAITPARRDQRTMSVVRGSRAAL